MFYWRMFCYNHRGQPLIANGGCISQASCCRQNEESEGAMLNLMDTLFIGTLLSVFMLSVGGDGLAIGRGMGSKIRMSKKARL